MQNSKKEHSLALLNKYNERASALQAKEAEEKEEKRKKRKRSHQDGETTDNDKEFLNETDAKKRKDDKSIIKNVNDTVKGQQNLAVKEEISAIISEEILSNSPSETKPSKSKRFEKKVRPNRREKKQFSENVQFMRLGAVQSSMKIEVPRELPHWLSHPRVVGQNLQQDGCHVSDIQLLHPAIVKKLSEEGIDHLFPVQKCLIPEILTQSAAAFSRTRANDLCVSAATGSGKTLAYVLPVLQALHPLTARGVITALVILPTEQLATQVLQTFRRYARVLGINVGSAIGSTSLKKEQKELVAKLEDWEVSAVSDGANSIIGDQQCRTHKALVSVVVATPDRLKDHMVLTPAFDLSFLRYLIFDEADKLMRGDGGQWINSIVRGVTEGQLTNRCPFGFDPLETSQLFASPQRAACFPQKLLVSATFSCDAEMLDTLDLYDPILYTTPAADPGAAHLGIPSILESSTKQTTRKQVCVMSTPGIGVIGASRPTTLTEQYIVVDQPLQPLMLHHLVAFHQWNKALVFTKTKDDAHRLAIVLEHLAQKEYIVAEFSARLGKLQSRMAENFRKGRINVLVCTDTLSRGMDFPDIDVVVNYDATECGETYVHRIGRTARAGKQGLAVTMLRSRLHERKFQQLTSQSGSVRVDEVEVASSLLSPLQQRYEEALEKLKLVIEKEKKMSKKKAVDLYVGVKLCKGKNKNMITDNKDANA